MLPKSSLRPYIFPALWCPSAFGARCQQPVPKGDSGVRAAVGSELSPRSVLTCTPGPSASAPGDTLRSYANFLYSVSFLPSTPIPPPPFPSDLYFFLLSLWFSLVKTLEKHANANVRCLQV